MPLTRCQHRMRSAPPSSVPTLHWYLQLWVTAEGPGLRRSGWAGLTWGSAREHRLLHSYASLWRPSSFRARALRKSARMLSLSRPSAFSLSSSAFSYRPWGRSCCYDPRSPSLGCRRFPRPDASLPSLPLLSLPSSTRVQCWGLRQAVGEEAREGRRRLEL